MSGLCVYSNIWKTDRKQKKTITPRDVNETELWCNLFFHGTLHLQWHFYISIIIDQFCQVKFNAKKNSNKKRKGLLHRSKDWKVSFDLKIKLFSTLGSEDIQDQLCRWGNSESHKQAQGRHMLSPEKTLSFHLKLISRLRGSPATWWRSAPAEPICKDWQRWLFFFVFFCASIFFLVVCLLILAPGIQGNLCQN